MNKHTPGPYHVGMKPGPIIYGPRGEQIADCRSSTNIPGENKAHAAVIVKACNSYEDTLTLARILAGKMYDDTVGRTAVQIALEILAVEGERVCAGCRFMFYPEDGETLCEGCRDDEDALASASHPWEDER